MKLNLALAALAFACVSNGLSIPRNYFPDALATPSDDSLLAKRGKTCRDVKVRSPGKTIRDVEKPGVTIRDVERPGVTIRDVERPGVTIRDVEKPGVTIRDVERSGVTIRDVQIAKRGKTCRDIKVRSPGKTIRDVEKPGVTVRDIERRCY